MMRNKTTGIQLAVANMKQSVKRYAGRVSIGLTRSKANYVTDMLYGMLVSQDVKLSKVGEALKEEKELKYTEERLRRNTHDFSESDAKIVIDNNMKKVIAKCRKDTPILIDGSDLTKPRGSKFEGLCDIRDGLTGQVGKGLPTVGAIALIDSKSPMTVYENIYSYEKDFVSGDYETLKALDFVDKHFPKDNIRVFGRGYGSDIVTEKLLDTGIKFIASLGDVRAVIHNGELRNVADLPAEFDSKYVLDFIGKKGDKKTAKISVAEIELPEFLGRKFNLVICDGCGEEQMLLITNAFDEDEVICKTIVKCYLLRWRIEELYRFKKTAFNFGDIRVMSLKAMNNINLLLNVLIGFISMKSTGGKSEPIIFSPQYGAGGQIGNHR